MKPARFLLRFDDICPTMNWDAWAPVEEQMLQAGVRPLLAVIPDNRDAKLQVRPCDPSFWERVRAWQRRGWTIGIHGYQHVYVTHDGGLMGLNAASEFAGLPAIEQAEKLRQGLAVFESKSVVPEAWVAPGHSFDGTTLDALRACGLGVVSDGFALLPFTDARGLTWIPQQLWTMKPRPFGVWTVCHHVNEFDPQDVVGFAQTLKRFQHAITSVPDLLAEFAGRRPTVLDSAFSHLWRQNLLMRRRLARLTRRHTSTPAKGSS